MASVADGHVTTWSPDNSEVSITSASDSIVAQRILQDSAAEAAAQKTDRATFPPTDPGPLSRLHRDATQVCFKFLSREDLATTHSVSPVWRAAHDAERTKRWLFAQQVPRMIKRLAGELQSEDERVMLPAVRDLRSLLSTERSPPIKLVLGTKGILERLIELVQRDHPDLQFEACWAITNLTSGTSMQCRQVINAGALPIFVKMLGDHRQDYREAQEQAVWALGNISGDGCEARDAVLRAGAVPPLLALLSSDSSRPSMMRNATWAVSNCVRGKPSPRWASVAPALPVIADIIAKGLDVEVLTDACWALSYMSDDATPNNAQISAVIATGVIPHLIQMLQHPNPRILTPALRSLGNIVTGDDLQTAAVLNAGILPVLLKLLTHSRRGVRKEAVWTVSNITAGDPAQIQACIDAGIVSVVIDLLIANEDEEVSNECSYALANSLTGGTVPQVCALVCLSALPALNVVLKSPKEPVLRVGLEALDRVMRAGDQLRDGGMHAMEEEEAAGAPLLLSSELRELIDAGEHPFAPLVGRACMRHLSAIAESETIDDQIVQSAAEILESWFTEAEVQQAIEAQEKAEREQAQRPAEGDSKFKVDAAAASSASAGSAPAMSEEEKMVEMMEQARITAQKEKDEARMAMAAQPLGLQKE